VATQTTSRKAPAVTAQTIIFSWPIDLKQMQFGVWSSSHPSLDTPDYRLQDLTRHYPVDLPGLFDHHLFMKIAIIDAIKKSDCLLSCRSR
jgi:hypothetical protein